MNKMAQQQVYDIKIDLTSYINSFEQFNSLQSSERKLISTLLDAPADYYSQDELLLRKSVNAITTWKYEHVAQEMLSSWIKEGQDAYYSTDKCTKCKEFDKSLNEIKIPRPYFCFGIVFLVAFCVFATIFVVQMFYDVNIIATQYLIMFLIASLGLLSTAIAAIIDWHRLKEGKRDS